MMHEIATPGMAVIRGPNDRAERLLATGVFIGADELPGGPQANRDSGKGTHGTLIAFFGV